ncbi:uncharacterized protein [Macrobrachium rosenbergii]|uniref:uncharacterized protein n=1 Tax=Macrobrachium rosenbergii TaxID=79674 RepID=UPI0034D638BC
MTIKQAYASSGKEDREHLNTLRETKKDQLRQIAERARISVSHAVVKAELLGKILDFLVHSGNITEEEALPLRPLTLERAAAEQKRVEAANAAAAAEQKRIEATSLIAETEQRQLELERKERVQLEKELSAIRLEERLAEKQFPEAFDLGKARKLLPVFDEKDLDVFFITFENTATSLNWPRDQYVLLIRNSFKGKAAYVAAQLVQERDYEVFKTAILYAYSVTAEGYRQIFRQTLKNQAQTYLEFFTLKLKQFNKWLDKEQITTLEQLKNLIVLEEFLRRIPANVSMFIREKQEKDGKRAALLANDYHLIHKHKPQSSSPSSATQICTFCKKEGHHIKDCPSPKCKASHGKTSLNAFQQGHKSGPTANKTTLHCAQPLSDFSAFTYPGKVNDIPVQILSYAGSSQTIISSKLKDLAQPTDQYVTVTDLTCQKVLPIVQISLDCPYFKGSTNVGVLDSDLPRKNMILGNDLAQTNSTPSLIITQPEVVIEKASQVVFSPGKELPCQVVTTSATLVPPKEKKPTGKVDPSILSEKVIADIVDIPSDEFVQYQKSDDSLKDYFDKVKDNADENRLPYFYLDNNILMRRYRPLKIAGQNSWHDIYQLVVPSNLRTTLLDLAHSAESQLGISKTYKRLLEDYYWPDCVGPIPKTKKQNEYILTVLCPTTIFPLAIPIKNISAETIIANRLEIFTIFGFPKELQCDQGTNFTSDCSVTRGQTSLNLTNSQIRMKNHYDKKAKFRTFKVGDDVLVYQPVPGVPLREKCMGPCKITKRVSKTTYAIETPDKRKPSQLVHINLIKPYQSATISPQVVHLIGKGTYHSAQNSRMTTPPIEGTSIQKTPVTEAVDMKCVYPLKPDEEETLAYNYILSRKDASNSHILSLLSQYLGHLPKVEREELEAVLKSYPAICSDTPGYYTLVKHVVLEPNTSPVRQPFYQVSHRLLPALKAEVEYLLKLDLAAPNRAKEISAFITPFGLSEYKVLPFGMTNAPSTFQSMVHEVIRGLEGVYAYLDDIVIASNTWDEHLKTLKELFRRLLKANPVINLAKSSFGKAKVTYLGHVIGSGSILPKDTNVKAITSFPTPSDKKELKTFLGMVSYYSKFCPNFAIITSLHALTSSKVRFHWNQDHDKAFQQLKLFMTSSPLLQAPNLAKPFFIQVNACNTGFGSVLLQETSNGTSTFPPLLERLLPISYYSGAFKGTQLGWPTIEKELFSIVATVLHFRLYLEGAESVVIYTDHKPVTFLERAKLTNKKLLR